jgi:hypothetical protein
MRYITVSTGLSETTHINPKHILWITPWDESDPNPHGFKSKITLMGELEVYCHKDHEALRNRVENAVSHTHVGLPI